MVHLTLAIADFMGILIGAALWTGAGFGVLALVAIGIVAMTLWGARKLVRRLLDKRR